ncbi:BMP family protein [Erysipelothrix urinaevulpis]|uniref:BMP family lipoprotein n=1 Tax=Erysipelothrix urinaevulpis TaxID=2683717 RepID=UPI001359FAE2|nr:BMP family ABC transporter substrate-binding protein [Erysipelothrix urinaevulpis]
MKKKLSLLLVVLLAFSLVACSANEKGEEDNKHEIILITDVGTIDDGSFNQGSYEGVKKYGDEHKVSYNYYRPADKDDEAYYEEITRAINEGGAKVIVTPGFLFEKAVHRAQKDYPDVKFIFIDGAPRAGQGEPDDIAENTYALIYEEQQAGFLAGYAAVKEGFTKLGFIGGMKVPAVEKFGIGYVAGADHAAKEMNVDVEIRYNYADTFEPSEAVSSLAAGWYADGTEVIFASAGGAGYSVFSAAEQSDKFTIGVDTDQYDKSTSIITSAKKELELSVYEALTALYDDKFPGGTQKSYGIQDDGIGISDKFDRFKTFTKEEYDQIYKKLQDDVDGLNSSIPKTHKPDFSDHTFDKVKVIVV